MSKLFKKLTAGLEDALAHQQGKIKLRTNIVCTRKETKRELTEEDTFHLVQFFMILIEWDQQEKEYNQQQGSTHEQAK